MPYRVLFVCTANICRSPTAELIARHRYGEERVFVRSAGFLRAGEPSPKLLLDALAEHGIDGSHHRSYGVDVATLEAADLVLTMEGEHVQRATLLHREAFAKIMPLTEAAATLRTHGPMTVEALVAEVNEDREATTYLTPKWDVADPYNRKLKDYRNAVDEISGLVDDLFRGLI